MDAKTNTISMVGGAFREEFREYEEALHELSLLLEIDEEDLEEKKEELYDEAKKASKFFAALDALPNISPDDDGAPREFKKWFNHFEHYISLNNLMYAIDPDRVLGFPKLLDPVHLPDLEPKPHDDDAKFEDLNQAYLASIQARNDAIRAAMPAYEKFLARYMKKVFSQRSLSLLIVNCCKKNAGAAAQLQNIPKNDIIGYLTYLKLKAWTENAKGRDLSVVKRNAVMEIPPMSSTADISNFIKSFKYNWAAFVEQFDDQVTDICPAPWTKDLPNKTVNTAILDHMPFTGEWGSYKMSMDDSLLDGPPLGFISDIQGKIDMLQRSSSSQNSMPASVHGAVPSPGADCSYCIRDPKGVPSHGHKPSDDICPHHKAWCKNRDKREANKAKQKASKAKAAKAKAGGGGKQAKQGPASSLAKTSDFSSDFQAQLAATIANSVGGAVTQAAQQIIAPLQQQIGTLNAAIHALQVQQGNNNGNFQQQPMLAHQPYGHYPPQNLNHYGAPPQFQAPQEER